MSTIGFISFIADGEAKDAYSHWDSEASELGVKVLRWLRSAAAQPAVLRATITRLKVVSDDQPPTQEEVDRFRQHGDPAAGNPAHEWYALLHATQGDPEAILECGHIVYEDDPFGWIYEINADEQTLSVSYDGDNSMTWPWSDLPTDHQFLRATERLDSSYE